MFSIIPEARDRNKDCEVLLSLLILETTTIIIIIIIIIIIKKCYEGRS